MYFMTFDEMDSFRNALYAVQLVNWRRAHGGHKRGHHHGKRK